MLSKRQIIAVLTTGIVAIVFLAVTSVELQDNNKRPTYSSVEQNKNSSPNTSINTSITLFNTPYIKEYSLPNNTWPNAILADKSGAVWIIGSKSHTLIKFDPNQGMMFSYPITEDVVENESSRGSLMAWTMVQDKDDNIWFSRLGESKIWRFSPSTGKFSSFQSSASAFQMKTDRDTGNIWFVTLSGNTLGVIQKVGHGEDSNYRIGEFNMGNDTMPTGLSVKKDHLWVTQLSSGKLLQFNVVRNAHGWITNISKTSEIPFRLYLPTDVLVSSNDTTWITEHGSSTITRYKPNSQPARFSTSSNEYQTTTLPLWLRESLDDKGIWFNEHGGNRIGFFDTSHMELTEYEIPSRPSDGYVVYPLSISVDPTNSNRLWFSEWNTDKIGVLTRDSLVPFEIRSEANERITIEDSISSQHWIRVQISRISGEGLPINYNGSNSIRLDASSPIDPAGRFANMTLKLVPDEVNLSTPNERKTVSLLIGNYSHILPGNYYLTISASNAIVTKSIFVNLEIQKMEK